MNISIDLPDEVFSAFRCTPNDFAKKMRLASASFWYQRGEISQEKAAQIAGLNRKEFLEYLAKEKIDVFQVDFDDLKQELSND
jgi:predicted HTH domain antitoxin